MNHVKAPVERTKKPRISILVPTFRRPQLLPKALASILAQQNCALDAIEVIVVDNCPDASARPSFERVREIAGGRLCLRYLHEPRPGISHARNRALTAARADHVLFLDDDLEAAPELIATYLRALTQTSAAILVGPVEPVFEATSDGSGDIADADMRDYFSRRYAVPNLADISDDIARLGTANALFDRHACFPDFDPFEPSLGLLGGEDTLMFRTLQQRGLRFAWVQDAVVLEFVPRQRQTQEYVRLRRFRSGQIRVLTALRMSPPRPVDVARWMAIGAVQAIGYGLISAVFRAVGNPRWHHMLSRAYGGAGKCLWTERFLFQAYGTTSRLAK